MATIITAGNIAQEFERVLTKIITAEKEQEKLNKAIADGRNKMEKVYQSTKKFVDTLAGGSLNMSRVTELSDKAVNNKYRAELILEDGGSLANLQSKILATANNSRTSFETTSAAVTEMAIRAGNAFSNNDEIMAFTGLIQKELALSGASASEMESAMALIIQAMEKGVLSGSDFNSILKAAPTLAHDIASYMGASVQEVQQLAEQGEVTAGVLKNSMFAASADIEDRFEQLPMTFRQLGTIFQNILFEAFSPLLEIVGLAAGWIYDNLSLLIPLFIGLAAAVAYYTAANSLLTAVTWLANTAQGGFFKTLMSNPLMWVAIVIGIIVAAVYSWIQSVGGLKVAWLIAVNAILTVLENLKLFFARIIVFMITKWLELSLNIQKVITTILTAISNLKIKGLTILESFINGAVDIINKFINAVNSITGASIKLVEHVTFQSMIDAEEKAQANWQNDLESDQKALDNAKADMQNALEAMGLENAKNQAERAAGIKEAQSAAQETELDVEYGVPPWDGGGAVSSGGFDHDTANNIADTAYNTDRIADSMEVSEEELKYLRDIAERQAINRFTTAEIKVDMGGITNQVSSELDLDGIVSYLEEAVYESMNIAAEGVHA